jgi:GAF domain/ANTAR domain
VLGRLCAAAARALAASGAGISVMTEGGVRVVAAASGEASARIDELQFTLGEGPCTDAFSSRRPVFEADLANGEPTRWPAYSAAAHEEGVRAVFAFPLQIGAARLGVLDLYREEPGWLSAAELTQALTFADVATTMLLDGQAQAPEGRAAEGLDEALDYHAEVHQAQGMVMVQLSVSLAEALALMRAYAYSDDRSLGEVARDVVIRTLRLDEESR